MKTSKSEVVSLVHECIVEWLAQEVEGQTADDLADRICNVLDLPAPEPAESAAKEPR